MVLSVQCEPLSTRWRLGFERERLAREDLPLRQGDGSASLAGRAVDEMAFEVEVVMDVGGTEVNCCSVFIRLYRSIARCRRRNEVAVLHPVVGRASDLPFVAVASCGIDEAKLATN